MELIKAEVTRLNKILESAQDKTKAVIDSMRVNSVINNAESYLAAKKREILLAIKPDIEAAFLSGEKVAVQIANKTTGEKTRVSSKVNLEDLDKRLTPFVKAMTEKNQAFVTQIKSWKREMQSSGMSNAAIENTFKIDWDKVNDSGNPAGRMTSQWKRAMVISASEMIYVSDNVGQENGYFKK